MQSKPHASQGESKCSTRNRCNRCNRCNTFPPFIVAPRVPPGEIWYYTRQPLEVVTPLGFSMLKIPDGKIVNIGEDRPKSKLDWVIAPH